jgi:hypothetical protein
MLISFPHIQRASFDWLALINSTGGLVSGPEHPFWEAPDAAVYAFRPEKKARKYISEFNMFN